MSNLIWARLLLWFLLRLVFFLASTGLVWSLAWSLVWFVVWSYLLLSCLRRHILSRCLSGPVARLLGYVLSGVVSFCQGFSCLV